MFVVKIRKLCCSMIIQFCATFSVSLRSLKMTELLRNLRDSSFHQNKVFLYLVKYKFHVDTPSILSTALHIFLNSLACSFSQKRYWLPDVALYQTFATQRYKISAFDLGHVTVMLDENITVFMKNLLIFAS